MKNALSCKTTLFNCIWRKERLTFVKRDVTTDHEGEVSTILHDELNEGDKINLSHL